MIKHCSGGVVLGFEQYHFPAGGILRRGSKAVEAVKDPMILPTAWNNLEAGALFSQNIPIMIFKEQGITGGIFDIGTTEVFVHPMPNQRMTKKNREALDTVFQKFSSEVRRHYYGE